MMHRLFHTILLPALFMLGLPTVFAQGITVSGATTANTTESKSYTANVGTHSSTASASYWSATGGTASAQALYSATITWNTALPANRVDYVLEDIFSDFYTGSLNVTVAVPLPTGTFTITNNCNSTNVLRNSSPPADYDWYWQTSSTGTSTALGSSSSVNITSAGTLYLRARTKTAAYRWSTAQTVGSITISTQPSVPSTAHHGYVISGTSVPVALSVSSSGASAYRWYKVTVTGDSLITGPTGVSYTPSVSATTDYKVEAMNGNCPAAFRKQVTANVYPEPIVSKSHNGKITMGQPVTLSVSNFSYDSYQWKRNGTNIPGATASSHTTRLAGNYTVSVTESSAPAYTPAEPSNVTVGPSGQDINYIVANTVLVKNITHRDSVDLLPAEKNSQVVQYVDGLGRVIQTVSTHGSPLKKDIIQPVVYDGFGRTHRNYLPVVTGSNTGWYNTSLIATNGRYQNTAANFYSNNPAGAIAQDTIPYSETFFEPSPLNRPLKQYGAGQEWKGNDKFVETKYLLNEHGAGSSGTAEKVIAWKVSSGRPARASVRSGYIVTGGYYTTGQLNIRSTKDEQGNEVREYTNKSGQVVLKKVQAIASDSSNLNSATGWALTYYVYDDLGNLRFVFPPEMSKALHGSDTAAANTIRRTNWAFQYTYDSRKRMITKQVPGAGPVYMVYDRRDRLVLTQDSVQRAKNEWLFTKYDTLNRPVMSGIYRHGSTVSRATMSELISTSRFAEKYDNTKTHGYTTNVFPTTSLTVLSATYYDSYNFQADLAGGSYAFDDDHLAGQEPAHNTAVRGQTTGSKISILGTGSYLWSVSYYDDKYRVIQTVAQNHLGSTDRVTNRYDFTGKVLRTKTTHSTASESTSISRTLQYDHAGRLLKTYHRINNQDSVLLSQNEYNELGQLVTKKLHSADGNNFKQHVDYRYNIRGWLTRINNSDLVPDDVNEPKDHFGMNLAYNEVLSGIGNTPQFNGNISATKYSTNQGFDADLKERAYKYTYDPMSRLTAATHYEKAMAWSMSSGLHEDNITYDLNTKMMSVRRKGATGSQMDNLTFTYTGNQLQTVTDSWDIEEGFADGNTSGADYTYDANGNRITDKNKGITAYTYNAMNQREKVTFSDGNYLLYTYDAAGNKLSQGVYNSSNVLQKKTDYSGEFFYENDTLKYISHEEGRYNTLANAYEYELRDHLGNNRITFTTQEEHDEAAATLETANLTAEQSKFLRYENARRISSHLFDKTNGTAPGYAVRLNGTTNEKYGLARSFAVVPGDTVKAEVYVKYIDTNSGNWTTALNTLLTQIAGGTAPAGTVIDGGSYGSSTSSFPFPGMLNTSGSSGVGPKAYLNWLVFDNNFTFVNGGYVRMSDAAREYGQDCAHEYLSTTVPITTAGYVYVYLSNENETPVEVYYDQFAIDLRKSPVINSTDLYPYGAPAISYSRENSLKQDRLLNGKETQDELGYNVVDLGQRDIDPFVTVFPTIDRFSEKYHSMSPCQYAAGNPVTIVDINGDSLWINYNGNNVLYQNGGLYNKDGTAYTGVGAKKDKNGNVVGYKGFLGQSFSALNQISAAEGQTGTTVISELQSSNNNFTITDAVSNPRAAGENEFVSDNKNGEYAVAMLDAGQGRPQAGGSGGTIYWNPSNTSPLNSVSEFGGGTGIRPTTNLAHELFHGYDSDRGLGDNRPVNGLKRNEWRAAYFENQIRNQMGLPYRESYNLRSGPVRLLTPANQPIYVAPPSTWFLNLRFK